MKLDGYSKYEIYPEDGKIWSYRSNSFIGAFDKDGYLVVGLKNDNGKVKHFGVHRIIWMAVNGKIPNGMEINHLDENKENNSISNLSLMSHKSNCNWGSRNERIMKNRKGKFRSKPLVALSCNNVVKYYSSTREAERNGFNSSRVSSCCIGKQQIAYGYKWQYVDEYLADWWEQEMDKVVL